MKPQLIFSGAALALFAGDDEGLPANVILVSFTPAPGSRISLLGSRKALHWQLNAAGGVSIEVPPATVQKPPCAHAFVFKLENTAGR